MNTDIGLAGGTQDKKKSLADMAPLCAEGIGYPGPKGFSMIPALRFARFNY